MTVSELIFCLGMLWARVLDRLKRSCILSSGWRRFLIVLSILVLVSFVPQVATPLTTRVEGTLRVVRALKILVTTNTVHCTWPLPVRSNC